MESIMPMITVMALASEYITYWQFIQAVIVLQLIKQTLYFAIPKTLLNLQEDRMSVSGFVLADQQLWIYITCH